MLPIVPLPFERRKGRCSIVALRLEIFVWRALLRAAK